MYVIIVGGGEVGRTVAGNLESNHNVAVIDPDTAVLESLDRRYDLLTVRGDGTDRVALRKAGIKKADMVVGVTGNDETNIVTCGTAKAIDDPYTIARVKRRGLLETWEENNTAYGVDFMVCTDLLAAEAIFRLAGIPGAIAMDTFVGGRVQLAKFPIPSDSPFVGQTIEAADQYDQLTFAAIFRANSADPVVIPTGDTRLQADDRVIVIGAAAGLEAFASDLTTTQHTTDEVVVIGGSEVGIQTARLFSERGRRTRLIEREQAHARTIAEELSAVTVLQNDATDIGFLKREHIDEANIVVAALNSEEKNLLVSLLTSQLGVDRTVSIVDQIEYTALFEKVGVDAAVSPRQETAEEITRATYQGRVENVAMLEHDSEVIELRISEDSILAGRSLAEVAPELPAQFIVGAITRDGSLLIPRGDTVVKPGDHAIMFVRTNRVSSLLKRL